jgi:hypothetical protein
MYMFVVSESQTHRYIKTKLCVFSYYIFKQQYLCSPLIPKAAMT